MMGFVDGNCFVDCFCGSMVNVGDISEGDWDVFVCWDVYVRNMCYVCFFFLLWFCSFRIFFYNISLRCILLLGCS